VSLIENGTFGADFDPFFEDNLDRVPDIAEVGPDYYTFTYSTTLTGLFANCPQQISTSRTFFHLRGISYRATVSLNGNVVYPIETPGKDAAGMFRRFSYEFSALSDEGKHTLSILVRPPDYSGDGREGGQGGDHQIARNACMQQSVTGW
jgi:hypothetical protein